MIAKIPNHYVPFGWENPLGHSITDSGSTNSEAGCQTRPSNLFADFQDRAHGAQYVHKLWTCKIHLGEYPQNLYAAYKRNMENRTREELAMLGNMGLAAASIRLHAARLFTGMTQKEFADATKTGKTTYNNMENGRSYPNRKVMAYLYRYHRIDFNFLMHGDFAQLPGDLTPQLFEKLASARHEWEQTQGLDPREIEPRQKPLQI